MMHLELAYQLRQVRNNELLMEAQQARTTRKLLGTRRLRKNDKEKTTMLKLTIRYACYVLATFATVGFAMN